MTATFLDTLLAALTAHADRPALVHRGRTWTHGEFLVRGQRLAARLRRLGLESGDRVALPLAGRLPGLIGQLGVFLAGGVGVPLNPRLPAAELPYYLIDSGAGFALVDPEQQSSWEALRAQAPTLRHVVVGTTEDEGSILGFRSPEVREDDPCLIIYSSGTTGWPKGVVHTQANLNAALAALAGCWRITPEDRVVHVLPLFHVHGLCFAALMPLSCGGCVLLEEGFVPPATLEALDEATVFMAVPTIWYRLLSEAEFRDRGRGWKRLRLCTCGSAPIRPEVLPELEAILGQPVINRYGMTEAHVITSLPLEGPWPAGSVGLPLTGVELQVRDEDGRQVGPDEVGTVWVRGPGLFRAYWNNPEATRKAFVAGWFDTGDLGRRDETGFLTLVGRKHDLIITSGFNVYPAAVERVLNACPGVRESAVAGLPDPLRGERVVAFIVREDPTLDEPTLTAYCQERLTGYQRPTEVVFVDELPRNSMGKVLRRTLRDLRGP